MHHPFIYVSRFFFLSLAAIAVGAIGGFICSVVLDNDPLGMQVGNIAFFGVIGLFLTPFLFAGAMMVPWGKQGPCPSDKNSVYALFPHDVKDEAFPAPWVKKNALTEWHGRIPDYEKEVILGSHLYSTEVRELKSYSFTAWGCRYEAHDSDLLAISGWVWEDHNRFRTNMFSFLLRDKATGFPYALYMMVTKEMGRMHNHGLPETEVFHFAFEDRREMIGFLVEKHPKCAKDLAKIEFRFPGDEIDEEMMLSSIR